MNFLSAEEINQASPYKVTQVDEMSKQFTLNTYSNIEDGVKYFYGIILRKDNPYHDKMINIFLDFFSDK